HDFRTGQDRQLTHLTTQPQGATWSPDGKRIAFFDVTGMWRVAQISVVDVETGTVTKVHDTLAQPGTPTWSPDGQHLALAEVAPMSRRFREGTNQILTFPATAHAPSWAGDSRHILYQSLDKLRLIDIESGEIRDIPVDLKYTADVPRGRMVVHAGTLIDMRSPASRTDADIVVEGNRIRSV